MGGAAAPFLADPRFDLPPAFVIVERRLAGQALDRWQNGGGGLVDGFDDHALVVRDPAGLATIESVGTRIATMFGLLPGMRLDGRDGLVAEVRTACDMIAIDPRPLTFEASLATPSRALVLARGIALPIGDGVTAADTGRIPDRVQVVLNWREVLDRAATTRLRRELGAALRLVPAFSARPDPFLKETSV